MTTYKDTDIREALRRKYARTPQLPADFMNRMQQATLSSRGGKRSLHRWVYPVSIAAAILIAFLVWPEGHEKTTIRQEAKPVVAKAESQPALRPIAVEKEEGVLTEVQPAPQPLKKQRKAVKKLSTPMEEPVLAQAGPVVPADAASLPQVDVQPSHEARVSSMDVGNKVIDPKMLLYTAERELEKSTHKRQEAYEEEKLRRGLELLLFLISETEDNIAEGAVNTQKC